jgi:hypothetical protein
MVGGRVAAHDEEDITVFEINPVIRHCATPERLCQSRYSWAVSDPGLVFNVHQTQPPQEFLVREAFFQVHGGAADGSDSSVRSTNSPCIGCPEALVAACF